MAEHLDENDKGPVPFNMEPDDKVAKIARSRVIESTAFDPETYEFSDLFEGHGEKLEEIRTLEGLVKYASNEKNKVEIDARVLCVNKEGKRVLKKMDTKEFLKECKTEERDLQGVRLKEHDGFLTDAQSGSGQVGQDYIPLLGGPFYKQLYIYDYLKMHSTAFHAYHHDPIARRIVNTMRDFTLGRGYQVTCKNPLGQALWEAFERVNDLPAMMDYAAKELEIYGEIMVWTLPNGASKVTTQLKGEQKIPVGALPRVRLIDPSVIWEIVTYPEDISRVLYYQWIAQTQYQIYSGTDQGAAVPSSKFIYQQVPGDQVDHFKINCVSNEKRGRSGLFPVLGYLKRLRDSVNYAIIGMQKSAAWAIDTEIDGSQTDIDAYVESQKELGTIAPAGSEFIHSTKVKREYVSNSTAGGTTSSSFEWCLSMIASGTGIPISYLNTHLSGGATRASALVATEPVTKMFEQRQLIYEKILQSLAKRLFDQFDLDCEIEVTFPELVVQDRSMKLKDLAMAESQGWISKKRAAEIAAQELQITEYDYKKERDTIEDDKKVLPQKTNPLTTPSTVDKPEKKDGSRSAIDSQTRRKLDMSGGI